MYTKIEGPYSSPIIDCKKPYFPIINYIGSKVENSIVSSDDLSVELYHNNINHKFLVRFEEASELSIKTNKKYVIDILYQRYRNNEISRKNHIFFSDELRTSDIVKAIIQDCRLLIKSE